MVSGTVAVVRGVGCTICSNANLTPKFLLLRLQQLSRDGTVKSSLFMGLCP